MNLLNVIKPYARNATTFVIRESPTILTWLSVVGLGTTVGLAVHATAKSVATIIIHHDDYEEVKPLSNVEIVKTSWKNFIPVAISGVITTVCIVGSNKINLKRNAALATAFAITETALREYQSKVVEILGEKKEEKIRDGISQDRLNKNPVGETNVFVTGRGESLFFDSLSGRYFMSNMEDIRKVENTFNYDLLTDRYKTLNEFYTELGLEETEMGRNIGWDTDMGMLELHFAAKISTDGRPCIVLEYKKLPKKL